MKGPITSPVIGPRFPIPNDPISPNPISSSLGARASYSFWSWAYLVSSAWAKALEATTPAAIACKTNGKRLSHFEIQSCMTLTDMRLTEFMGLTEKSAITKLFI